MLSTTVFGHGAVLSSLVRVCFPPSTPFCLRQHTLCSALTKPGEDFDRAAVVNNVVAFAERACNTVASVVDPDCSGLEVSVDLALNMGYEKSSGLILLPSAEYFAGVSGASSRGGAGHEGGRGGDLRFENVTTFSLCGTDQATSISGES